MRILYRLFKVVAVVLVLFVVAAVVFYFWATSSTRQPGQYQGVFTASGNASAAKGQPVPLRTLKVATYNLGYLSGMTNNKPLARTDSLLKQHMQLVQGWLAQDTLQILALQEIDFEAHRSGYVDQSKALLKQPLAHAAWQVNWDKRYVPFPYWPVSTQFKKVVSGQAVLSSIPVLQQQRTVLAKPANNPFWYNAFYLDRLAQVVHLNTSPPLTIINVHLEAFDAPTRAIHVKRVLDLYQTHSANGPVLLMGDFNAPWPIKAAPVAWQDSVLNELKENLGLQEAAHAYHGRFDMAQWGTYSSGQPDRKIDHIFFDPALWLVQQAQVIKRVGAASDHRPFAATLTFKPALNALPLNPVPAP